MLDDLDRIGPVLALAGIASLIVIWDFLPRGKPFPAARGRALMLFALIGPALAAAWALSLLTRDEAGFGFENSVVLDDFALFFAFFFGLFLFVSIIYLSVKSLIMGMRQLARVPGAEVVQVWGMALLASMASIMFQISTLSFCYHPVLWIFFGLVGAWTGAIRHHRPDFTMKLTWRDIFIILAACVAYVFVFLPIFLKYKGEM